MLRTRILTWGEVQRMCQCALEDGRPDVAAMFALGAGFGLRIGDVLRLRWRDVIDVKGNIVDRLEIKERKRGALRILRTPAWVKTVLERYQEALGDDFDPDRKIVPFGREWSWELLKRYAERAGISPERVGTHSLRKSFCQTIYERTRDPAVTAKLTGHRSAEALLAYIGALSPTAERILDEIAAIGLEGEGD